MWEKLKAYEDTWLEPEQCENAKNIIELAFSDDMAKVERIRKLLKADKEGRLVVRHGSWEEADWIECSTNDLYIRTPRGARRCSECKRCFKKELLWKDNYCPNCGARMDGGDKNG